MRVGFLPDLHLSFWFLLPFSVFPRLLAHLLSAFLVLLDFGEHGFLLGLRLLLLLLVLQLSLGSYVHQSFALFKGMLVLLLLLLV